MKIYAYLMWECLCFICVMVFVMFICFLIIVNFFLISLFYWKGLSTSLLLYNESNTNWFLLVGFVPVFSGRCICCNYMCRVVVSDVYFRVCIFPDEYRDGICVYSSFVFFSLGVSLCCCALCCLLSFSFEVSCYFFVGGVEILLFPLI